MTLKPSKQIKEAGDVLRGVAQRIDDTAKNVAHMPTPDTIGVRDIQSFDDFKVWFGESAAEAAKYSGAGLLFGMEYVVRLLNSLIVDNVALRKMADAYARVKLSRQKPKNFFGRAKKLVRAGVKNNPIVTAYFSYLAMWAVATGGTALAVGRDKDQDDAEKPKTEVRQDTPNDNVRSIQGGGQLGPVYDIPTVSHAWDYMMDWAKHVVGASTKDETVVVMPGTFGAYRARMQGAMPMIVAELVAMEGVRMKDGMHVVYDDATGKPLKPGQTVRGKATIGYGNTVGKDHEEITSYTPPITSEEAFELSRWHLEEKETFLAMYCYDVACKEVDVRFVPEAMGIASAIYNGFNLVIEESDANARNRFEKIRKLYAEYGDALSDEQVLECFKKYPIKSPAHVGKHWLNGGDRQDMADGLGWYINVKRDGDGIRWRRWLEACIMTGDITPQDLLRIPVNGMSEFFDYVGRGRDNWFIVRKYGKKETRKVNKATLQKFKKWLENPVNKRGQSLASWKRVADVMPEDAVAQCLQYRGQTLTDVTQFVKTKRQNTIEKETYVIGYQEAYADALQSYQNRDFQAAAQKYEQLIKDYPRNALLYNDLAATYINLGRYQDAILQSQEIVRTIGDKSQYAAAQYNAGLAYEMLGDLDKALHNYKLAVRNGNRRVQKDVARVKEAIKQRDKKSGNGRVAFNSAARKMRAKNPNARGDVLVYGVTKDVNGLA